MERTPNRQPWPPMVSGAEPKRQRTGVIYQKQPVSRQEQTPSQDCCGILPARGMLANPYVPTQQTNSQRYATNRAFVRGTLYPSLDLPLCGMVNNDKPSTPSNELMALQFAMSDLAQYLDTHPDDTDAVTLFQEYAARCAEAKAAYEAKHGPILMKNAGENGTWDWICDPWPWEICQEG